MLGAWRTAPLPPRSHRSGSGERGLLIPAGTLGAGRERPRGGRGAGAEHPRVPPARSHGNAPARYRDNVASLWSRWGRCFLRRPRPFGLKREGRGLSGAGAWRARRMRSAGARPAQASVR